MNRRTFLQSGAGVLLGSSELAFLAGLEPVSAAQVKVDPGIVRFDSGIEPLVRLLEDTPRERLWKRSPFESGRVSPIARSSPHCSWRASATFSLVQPWDSSSTL